jgi:hypothetical protein
MVDFMVQVIGAEQQRSGLAPGCYNFGSYPQDFGGPST